MIHTLLFGARKKNPIKPQLKFLLYGDPQIFPFSPSSRGVQGAPYFFSEILRPHELTFAHLFFVPTLLHRRANPTTKPLVPALLPPQCQSHTLPRRDMLFGEALGLAATPFPLLYPMLLALLPSSCVPIAQSIRMMVDIAAPPLVSPQLSRLE